MSKLTLPFEFADIKACDIKFLNGTVGDRNYDWELKRDGTAAMIHADNNYVKIYGRGILQDGSVSDYTNKFPEIIKTFKTLNLRDSVFVGELCVMEGMLERFKYLQTRTTRKHDIEKYIKLYPSTILLFDILRYRGKDISDIPYKDRREILEYLPNYNCFNIEDNIQFISKQISPTSKVALWKFIEKNKREGVVIKHKNAIHGEGIYKYKRFETQEVWVTGYKEGTGRLEEMGLIGSLYVSQYVNGKVVDCGRVGSGLDDSVRQLLTPIVTSNNYSTKTPIIIEVKYNELTTDGKFRHPRFLRIRTDKGKQQCVRK